MLDDSTLKEEQKEREVDVRNSEGCVWKRSNRPHPLHVLAPFAAKVCDCHSFPPLILIAVPVVERVVSSLLHDAEELLRIDLAVVVAISLVDHLLDLVVRAAGRWIREREAGQRKESEVVAWTRSEGGRVGEHCVVSVHLVCALSVCFVCVLTDSLRDRCRSS